MRVFLVFLLLIFCLENRLALADEQSDKRLIDDFYIGKKYCKRGTINWDDQCQDKVVENLYGKDWRKFKEVIIKFLKAMKDRDPKVLSDSINIPMVFLVGYFDDNINFIPRFVECKSLEYFLSGYKFALDSFSDLYIEYNGITFYIDTTIDLIMVMYNNHVGFTFLKSMQANDQYCFIPKINIIRY